jgi:hypothetical protein
MFTKKTVVLIMAMIFPLLLSCHARVLKTDMVEKLNRPFIVTPGLFDHSDPDNRGLVKAAGTQTFTVYSPSEEKGDNLFNNHPQLISFKGDLYATWQGCKQHEDSQDSFVLYSKSSDGKNWSKPEMLVSTPEGELFRASSGWWKEDGRLYALFHKRDKNIPRDIVMEEYRVSIDGKEWSEIKVLIPDAQGSESIEAIPDGRLLWLGHGQGVKNFTDGYVVRLLYSDNGISGPWKESKINHLDAFRAKGVNRLIEPSWYRRSDGKLVMVYRDIFGSCHVWASLSDDNGQSWSKPVITGLFDSSSMQCAGNLPDGTAYLVNNPVDHLEPRSSLGKRIPLAVTLSRDGFVFDRSYLVRGTPPERRYKGKSKTLGYSYPGSYIWREYLYISYATNKEDIEVTRIPLSSLMEKDN